MDIITYDDLKFVNDLSSRSYSDNKMLSKASELEHKRFLELRKQLKRLITSFDKRYSEFYGPFVVSVSTGNPIAIGGSKLNTIWAGIFKGASNKQYSAQISFVMDPVEPCLNVGFYFGRASGHSLTVKDKKLLETKLNLIGATLSREIVENSDLNRIYNSLFDNGFKAYSNYNIVNSNEWLNQIAVDPKKCEIIYKIYPNKGDYIEYKTIDYYVAMVIGLMNPLSTDVNDNNRKKKIKPLTPEQRAKQAERRTLIGQLGEEFAMEYERKKLERLNIKKLNYPFQVSLESMNEGYDILSCDENGKDIFIEVKSTTRSISDLKIDKFFISSKEHEFYTRNKEQFRLYRVYDVEGWNTDLRILEMGEVNFISDGYIGEIKTL